jgi:hypothetical protein
MLHFRLPVEFTAGALQLPADVLYAPKVVPAGTASVTTRPDAVRIPGEVGH